MVSILPRLATGIVPVVMDQNGYRVSILPRLATGIVKPDTKIGEDRFYSSPSCDGDRSLEF